MTIDEKLKHFQETITEEAEKEAWELLESHRKKLEEEFLEYKRQKTGEAQTLLKTEMENAQKEKNRAICAEGLSLKQEWNRQQTQLTKDLFSAVRTQLELFMATPEYEEYLYHKIMDARKLAGKEEIFIYMSSSDADLLPVLKERTGLPISLSEKSFLGGIFAKIPSRNILINHSFLDIFTSLQEEFTLEGGEYHG